MGRAVKEGARREAGRGDVGRSEADRLRRQRPRLPEETEAGDGVVVNGYSERWLRRGFPWVYENEVLARTGELLPGRVITIRSRQGEVLGTGIWDRGKVEVRRFRTDEGPVDVDLLRERIVAARVRRSNLPPETTAWRWVHGENDDLPGIRVDVLGPDLLLTLDAPGLRGLLDPLVEVLVDERETRAVWLAWRPGHEDDPVRAAKLPRGLIHGEASEQEDVIVQERGVKVAVRPWEGPDVGLYSDMRDVRAWLEPHWRGRRMLNLFACTGMFSVCAALQGAWEVHTVDLSQASLDRAKVNFRLNNLDPDAHVFEAQDSFRALDARRRQGERFDMVVADPPAFSHSEAGTWSISQDLPRLVASCLRVLEPGGWLVVASNLGTQSPKDFQHDLQKGAARVGRSLRLVHEGSPPLDFPAALDFPESRYLKCWVLQA